MILRFKTKRNANGHRKILAIDTDKKVFCTDCPRIIPDGAEIKSTDYKQILQAVKNSGYQETQAF